MNSTQPNSPRARIPPRPEFASVYYNMSQGEGDLRGPWNQGQDWEYVEQPGPAVDGGDGMASVKLPPMQAKAVEQLATRTMSDPEAAPVTGADLGAGLAKQLDKNRLDE